MTDRTRDRTRSAVQPLQRAGNARFESPSLALSLAAALMLNACGGAASGQPDAPALTPVPFQTGGVDMTLDSAVRPNIGGFEVRGSFELKAPVEDFGGVSGLAVEGDRLWLVSDRATLWSTRLVTDSSGDLAALEDWRSWRLVDAAEPRRKLDTEELSLLPDGRLLVSDEETNRLGVIDPPEGTGPGKGKIGRLAVDFAVYPQPFPLTRQNRGVEAAAALPDGRVLAISEDDPSGNNALPAAIVGDGGDTTGLAWRPAAGFSPTGAAGSLDGSGVYVLERRVGLLSGFEARLAWSPLDDSKPDATLPRRELFALGAGQAVDNYEGVAVRRDAQGHERVLLVSDDNQLALQRTLLIELLAPSNGVPVR